MGKGRTVGDKKVARIADQSLAKNIEKRVLKRF